MTLRWMKISWIALLLAAPVTALAQDSTQPSRGQMLNPVAIVERIQQRVEQMRLSPMQSTRADSILNAAMEQAEELNQQIRDLPPDEKLQRVLAFREDLRSKLAEVMPRAFADSGPGFGGGQVLAQIQRIGQAMYQLNLSGDQAAQAKQLFVTLRTKLLALHPFRQTGPGVRAQVQALVQDFQSQLNGLLTPDQQQQFTQLMRHSAGNNNQPTGPPPPPLDATPSGNNPFVKDNSQAPDDSKDQQAQSEEPTDSTPPAPSDATLPDHIRLENLDYSVVDLMNFKNHILVLEFGSVTSPTFRDHIAAMDALAQKYAGDASFFIVYTKEAHPADGWDVPRNQDDQIAVRQPIDNLDRREIARKTQAYYQISIPILVDDDKDTASKAFNGFPNATVVIGRDGKVIARQQWNDPTDLGQIIERAIGGK